MPQLGNAEFRALRSFARFTGMGVFPSAERADVALEVIRASGDPPELAGVRKLAEGVRAGLLASQAACIQACRDLERLMSRIEAQNDQPAPGLGGA